MELTSKIVKIIDNKMVLFELDNLNTPIKEFYQPCIFDGDIVKLTESSSEYYVVSSPIRTNPIIGYFSTSQQVKFGKTPSGATIYQVKPFNPALPYFLVSYAGKQTGKLIITFKFKEWVKGLPRGEIIQLIGPYDASNLISTLQYNYRVQRTQCKIKPEVNPQESTINRIEINELVFSIDPIGCVDIDDAISWTELENTYNIKVHIAQPTYWLTELDLITRAKIAFSTLYQDPYKPNGNLWGDAITKASSLLPGIKKPSYTMEFTVDKNTNEITEFIHYPSWIINTHAIDYETCLSICTINKFYELTKKISSNPNLDTHELVSYWMIKANTFLGESNKIKSLNVPYRITLDQTSVQNNIEIHDTEVAKAFESMQMDAAIYSIDNSLNYHKGLNTYNYIHFTSPIRRMSDTLIHWCLTYNINFKDLLNKYNFDFAIINQLDTQTKKFHNQIKFLTLVDNLKLPELTPIQLTGWIYSNTGNRWTIYFKELGFVRVKMWDFKFNYLTEDLSRQKILEKKVGEKMWFEIWAKPGFLPKEKILIVPLLNLI